MEMFFRVSKVSRKDLVKAMSQSKMDLWGDFLLQVVFTLALTFFCVDKRVRCINTGTAIQVQTHTHACLFVCLYHATNSNSNDNNYYGFTIKLYCSCYDFQCCFTVNRNFL